MDICVFVVLLSRADGDVVCCVMGVWFVNNVFCVWVLYGGILRMMCFHGIVWSIYCCNPLMVIEFVFMCVVVHVSVLRGGLVFKWFVFMWLL